MSVEYTWVAPLYALTFTLFSKPRVNKVGSVLNVTLNSSDGA